jgi:hypothetical protein
MIVFVERPGSIHFGLLVAIALSFWIWPVASKAYTADQQQACTGDAFRLCSAGIPDVDRVTACMVRQKSQLSPGCRVFFRPEPTVTPVAAVKLHSVKHAHKRKTRKPKKHSS